MKKYYLKYKTEKGDLTVIYDDNGIVYIFLSYDLYEIRVDIEYKADKRITDFFDKYFMGEKCELPKLNIKVTDFQRRVFEALLSTERGTLITYGELAKMIGCASPHAIGQALKRNPVPILIPCHRVIGSGWKGGFGGEVEGEKMDFKQFLMKSEGIERCSW